MTSMTKEMSEKIIQLQPVELVGNNPVCPHPTAAYSESVLGKYKGLMKLSEDFNFSGTIELQPEMSEWHIKLRLQCE